MSGPASDDQFLILYPILNIPTRFYSCWSLFMCEAFKCGGSGGQAKANKIQNSIYFKLWLYFIHANPTRSTRPRLTPRATSSQASVEVYNRQIKPSIDAINNSKLSLEELVHAAEKIVNDKFAPDARSTLRHTANNNSGSVSLSQVMLAMLAHAEECGREKGKRYVATAILACSEQANEIEALEALGTTWVTHLLFIFKCSRAHANQTPSGNATPIYNQTASHLIQGTSNRKESFHDVKIRDGFMCMITGYQDKSRPDHMKRIQPLLKLQGSHILPKAIGKFDVNLESYKSALTTFDILMNFTSLPFKTLEELDEQLDDPSNGITLQADTHNAFVGFQFCLKKTEKEHVYNLKIYEGGLLRKPENNRVIFVDHSDECFPLPNGERDQPISLPNPMYLEIHTAVAGIMNMSGAGIFFDELLDKYQGSWSDVPAVDRWSDMEALMETELLRESVAEALQSIRGR